MKKIFYKIVTITILIFCVLSLCFQLRDNFNYEEHNREIENTVKNEIERVIIDELQVDVENAILNKYVINSSSIKKYANVYLVELQYTTEFGKTVHPTYIAEVKCGVWTKYNSKENTCKIIKRNYEIINDEIIGDTNLESIFDCTYVVSISKDEVEGLAEKDIAEQLLFDWFCEAAKNYDATFLICEAKKFSIKEFEAIRFDGNKAIKEWAVSGECDFKFVGYYYDGRLPQRGGSFVGTDGKWIKNYDLDEAKSHILVFTEFNDCYTFTANSCFERK